MTIAQQLKITEFPFEIKNSNGKLIYYEDSYAYWAKYEYDASGNQIYWENSNGSWSKREWDASGNVIYFENSNGTIVDKRPKTEIQKAIELLIKAGLLVDGKILNKL